MDLYPVDWQPHDPDPEDPGSGSEYEIRMFAKTASGRSVCARIKFPPYFYVKAPPSWSFQRQKLFIADACQQYGADPGLSMPVRRKDIWGYSRGTEEPFMQLAFRTLKACRIARSVLAKSKMLTYEGTIDSVIRFFHLRNVSPSEWVRIESWREVDVKVSRADLEVAVAFTDIGPTPLDAVLPGPPGLILASWDIECWSESGGFPKPDNPNDACIQIATAFQRLGEAEPYLKTVVVLDTCDDIPGVEIIAVATEAEVITTWMELIHRESVDVLLGYNVFQFDWRYIRGRCAVLTDESGDPLVDLGALGRSVDGGGEDNEWELNSGAFGQNKFFLCKTPGLLQIDVIQWMRREKKLDSYSLKNVSTTYLGGETKVDLPIHELFAKFKGSSTDRRDIAEYAVQDTLLPLKLVDKLGIFTGISEMAAATCVPVSYVLSRGQQVRVMSLILRQAREMGYVCPDNRGITLTEKYAGATVLSPKCGAFFQPIAALDFASLYPSIIRAHNLCYSTMVIHEPAPVDAVYSIETGLGTFEFAQDVPGVLPKLLERLAQYRKDARAKGKACKDAGDAWGASLYEGRQLAFKVSMNSVYGFLGASKGYLPAVPVAAAVTATGRAMIEKTKQLAESLAPGSDVIYGDTDSVLVRFKIPEDAPDAMRAHFEIAQRVANEITKTL